MADQVKSPAVAKAEADLKALERFHQAVQNANAALGAAKMTADPERIAAAEADLAAARKAEAESGVTDRDIAIASQAVLDARGETHTEENILPPDHGLRTVEADADLATALARGNQKRIAEAQRALDDAITEDAREKSDHVAASHERTMANIEGAKS
jgi:hypothetical protein